MIGPPAFWWEGAPTPLARLLSPLGAVWGAAAARRMAQRGASCGVPVVCVGNFVVGGAGKTPVAIAVGERLARAGVRPFFLSRGYGGRPGGAPLHVEPGRHGAAIVGDEPLLLARAAPTVVGADRRAGAAIAVAAGAGAIVMDDGLQNPRLAKRLSIAVVDGAVGVGNGLCPPAGPLRAPLAAQWPFVDALIVLGAGAPGEALMRAAQAQGKAAFRARLRPDAEVAARLRGCRVAAFAGIGRPAKFFDTLVELGADVVRRRAFPDHHRYRARDIRALVDIAAAAQALLVTTQKDAVRLPDGAAVLALPVRLDLEDTEAFDRLLARAA